MQVTSSDLDHVVHHRLVFFTQVLLFQNNYSHEIVYPSSTSVQSNHTHQMRVNSSASLVKHVHSFYSLFQLISVKLKALSPNSPSFCEIQDSIPKTNYT